MPSRSETEVEFEVVDCDGARVYEGDLETCKFAADLWASRKRWSRPEVRARRVRRFFGWNGGLPVFAEGKAGGVVYRA